MELSRKIGSYFASWRDGRSNEARVGRGDSTGENDRLDEEKEMAPSSKADNLDYEKGEKAMDEDRLQILKMVEEHKITAEEAAKLLSALDSQPKPSEPISTSKARWLRIRVTDVITGRNKVNVNVPFGVISAAGKLGARFGLQKYMEKEGIDVDELLESIRAGAEGKLLDVTNDEGTEHVEIFLE